jgi:hypothetical protein
MRHYHSAEQLADKAVAAGCSGLNYYHSAALQYGQALAHEQSGGGGFEVEARKKNASMAMTDASRVIRKCIKP